jgi:hypothetical protein
MAWPRPAHSRLPSPPPFDALLSYRRRPDDTLNVMRAMRAAIVWEGRTGAGAALQYLRYVDWLIRFPLSVASAVRRYGRAAREHLGRSLSGQIADLFRLGIATGLMPKDYYLGGLARHGGEEAIFGYMPYRFYETVAGNLTVWYDRGSHRLPGDKIAFEEHGRALGLPFVRTLHVIDPERDITGEGFPAPPGDVLIKPNFGGQGEGIELWVRREDGRFERIDTANADWGRSREPVEWLRLIAIVNGKADEDRQPMLIQEREVNHPSLDRIAGPALATTRFLTMLDENGEPEIIEAFYRTSIDKLAPVDNFHAGGTFYVIDPATGRFLPGYGADFAKYPLTREDHPISGVRMAGETHPGWEEMSALALRAHRAFPDLFIIGWDIAYSARGALVVEGNTPPGLTTTRQHSVGGFVHTRRAQLLAHHARKWLAAHTAPDSRFRPGADL